MAKIKYYYDTETCRYERVKVSTTDVVINAVGVFFVCVILGVLFAGAYLSLFPSARESRLMKENEELSYHYNLLSNEMTELRKMMLVLQERDDEIYRVIFEAEPIPDEIRLAGAGGSQKYKDLYDKRLSREDIIIGTFQKVDALKRQMYVQTKSYDEILNLAKSKTEMLSCIPAIQPIANKDLNRIASGFGMRFHPILKFRRMHAGMDFSAPKGTPVYATGDGVVIEAERAHDGYGNQVVIDHGFGYVTRYAHLSAFAVKKGTRVKRGQVIGDVGSTGLSVANHLHYEVIYKGKPVDPVNYFYNELTPEQYEKMLELSSQENSSLGF